MSTIDNLTFGVELEVYLPQGMLHAEAARVLTEAGVSCRAEGYNHETRSQWKVVTDGSLGDYRRGAEFVSPPMRGEAGFAALRTVCNTLVALGATVHRSCGFHVHVGARGEPIDFFKNLGRIYGQYEAVIDTLLSPSRRGSANTYCKPLRVQAASLNAAVDLRSVQRALGATGDGDRFWKLNLAAFYRHGTVEFRHHQGTVDADKAVHWVKLCLRICARAKQVTPQHAASPVVVARSASRDRWLPAVMEMLLRPEGCTREEVMARTGQQGARMPRRTAESGLIVVKRRRGNEVRFYGRRPEATATVQDEYPITLDGLMALVAAERSEWEYFATRQSRLNRAA